MRSKLVGGRKGGPSARLLPRVARELPSRYRRALGAVIGIIAVQAALSSATPVVLRDLIDAIPERNEGAILWAAALVTATIAGYNLLSLVQRTIAGMVLARFATRFQVKLFEHLGRLDMAFYTERKAGEVQAVLGTDFTVIRRRLLDLTDLGFRIFTLLAGLVAFYAIDSRLIPVALALAPATAVWAVWLGRKSKRVREDERAADARLATVAAEAISVPGCVLQWMFGDVFGPRVRAETEKIAEYARREQQLERFNILLRDVLRLAPVGLFLVIFYTRSVPSVGTMAVMSGVLTAFQAQVGAIVDIQLRLTDLPGRLRDVFDLLDEKVKIEEGSREIARGRPLGLSFEGVSFRYDQEGEEDALRDVSIDMPAGAFHAIVGPSGAGKSTIGALAARLADPVEGTVRIGGMDVREATRKSLRRAVGYVPQDLLVLHDTLAANVCLGDPDADESRIRQALAAAGLAGFVNSLPDGLDTVVGAGGHRLSGGEAQRLVLARALFADPRVLVLDEATSALDNRTQREVGEALTKGRTVLVIAHRLSTVRGADRIHVLDGGRIVESGTHRELMGLNGQYSKLVAEEQSDATRRHGLRQKRRRERARRAACAATDRRRN